MDGQMSRRNMMKMMIKVCDVSLKKHLYRAFCVSVAYRYIMIEVEYYSFLYS